MRFFPRERRRIERPETFRTTGLNQIFAFAVMATISFCLVIGGTGQELTVEYARQIEYDMQAKANIQRVKQHVITCNVIENQL